MAIDTLYSRVNYTGNGIMTSFIVPFPYLYVNDVHLSVDDEEVSVYPVISHDNPPAGYGAHWYSSNTIRFVTAPASDAKITIQRTTNRAEPEVEFENSAILTEEDLNLIATQLIYIVQEAYDHFALSYEDALDAINEAKEDAISAKEDAENARDIAANYADSAEDSATDAGNSATAAQETLDQVKLETIGKIDNVMARGMFQCEGVDPDVGYESIYIPDSYKVGTHSLMLFDNDGNLLTPKTINPTTYDYDEVGSTTESSHYIKMYGTTYGDKYQYEIIGLSAASLVDDDTIKWDAENGISVDAEAVIGDVDQVIEEKVIEAIDTHGFVSKDHLGIINVKDYGAKGDGVTNDTTAISNAFADGLDTGKTVYIPSGIYKITRVSTAVTDTSPQNLNIICEGELHSVADNPLSGSDNDYAVGFFGYTRFVKKETPSGLTISASAREFTCLKEDYPIHKGDILIFRTNRSLIIGYRGDWTEGIIAHVQEVTENGENITVTLEEPLSIYLNANTDVTGITATGGSINTAELTGANIMLDENTYLAEEDMIYDLVCLTGANAGKSNKINAWDATTHTATFNIAWDNAVTNGDTFTLQRRATIACHRPITVKANGLKITRELQTNATIPSGSNINDNTKWPLGFIGLHVDDGVDCHFQNTTIENFSENEMQLRWCWKPTVLSATLSNANRYFSTSGNPLDGTGYGLLLLGTVGGSFSDIVITGCRSGLNNGVKDLLTKYNMFNNVSIFNGHVKTYCANNIGQTGQPEYVKCMSAVGGHGGNFNNSYSNINIYNVDQAVTMNGVGNVYENINIFGNTRVALLIAYVYGVTLNNIKFFSTYYYGDTTDEDYENKMRHFCIIRNGQYKRGRPIIIKNVQTNNEMEKLIYFADVDDTKVIEDINISNIHAYYKENATSVGLVRENPTVTPPIIQSNMILNKCSFTGDNVLHYDGTAVNYGFGNVNTFKIKNNGWIRASTDIYLVKPVGTGTVSIPLAKTPQLTKVTIGAGNGSTYVAQSIMLWDITGGSGDLNPSGITSINKASGIAVKNSSTTYSDGKYYVWREDNNLNVHCHNVSGADSKVLSVQVEYVA